MPRDQFQKKKNLINRSKNELKLNKTSMNHLRSSNLLGSSEKTENIFYKLTSKTSFDCYSKIDMNIKNAFNIVRKKLSATM
ncbi:hypothetical protein BpHYR1_023357 [Brachionus plicatilis]|uniref:Uncharacterized protein n=1 Tax=Brachionus plicatilis TaxID=10195 RepID=A0A3M7SPP5_BRAPC|nr:hypothetical protein BpHYR1_023357 [Brachionus plicatilis]